MDEIKKLVKKYSKSVTFTSGVISGLCLVIAVKGNGHKLLFWRYFRKQKIDDIILQPKMALLVRNDIPMSFGKQLSQVSHAAVNCYLLSLSRCPEILKKWESLNRPMVVGKVSVLGNLRLKQIHKDAKKHNIPSQLIYDAGRTELRSGTLTAVGVGPADSQLINKICGEFTAFE